MKRILSVVLGLVVGILTGWGVAAYASRSSTGTYTLPSGNPVVTGTTITSTWANNTLSDLSTEMTGSLSRNGYGGMLAALRGTNGSAAAPSFSFTSDTNTGMYRGGADDVRIVAGGTDTAAFSAAAVSLGNAQITSVGSLKIGTGGTISPYSGALALTGTTSTITSTAGTGLQVTSVAGIGLGATAPTGYNGINVFGSGASIGGGSSTNTAIYAVTGGTNAHGIESTGNGTGAGFYGTGGATGPGGTFTAGTTATPTAGQIHLVPGGAVPSSPTDGDIWFKSSGTIGWRANAIQYYPQKGTCTLNGASPAVCTVTVTSGVTYCTATPIGTTAAVAARPVATSVSGTTLTVTGPNADADAVAVICM